MRNTSYRFPLSVKDLEHHLY